MTFWDGVAALADSGWFGQLGGAVSVAGNYPDGGVRPALIINPN